jgi:hypothetical protein
MQEMAQVTDMDPINAMLRFEYIMRRLDDHRRAWEAEHGPEHQVNFEMWRNIWDTDADELEFLEEGKPRPRLKVFTPLTKPKEEWR